MNETTVHVKVADAGPFRLLAKGLAEAAEMFASLTEAEQASLPDAALLGIARLRGALAEFSGEAGPLNLPDDEPLRYGLVIEWPGRPAGVPAHIPPRLVSAFELTPGGERQVLPVRMSLHMPPGDVVSADVELLVGEDGEPVTVGQFPDVRNGEAVTSVLRYEVAEMRARQA